MFYSTTPSLGRWAASRPTFRFVYAKTLEPGSPYPNVMINRSWTIAYFGDAQANPHEYVDKDKVPWTKAREARLKRFQETSYKALRFRILDLPLMYCFYVDRDWRDVNEADYKIIKSTDIENAIFSEEEKTFMRQKKKKSLENLRNTYLLYLVMFQIHQIKVEQHYSVLQGSNPSFSCQNNTQKKFTPISKFLLPPPNRTRSAGLRFWGEASLV